MFALLKRALYPGATVDLLQETVKRNPLSVHLPWISYDPESKLYRLRGDRIGFGFECRPISYLYAGIQEDLDGLLRLSFPDNATLQVTLYADPYVDPIINSYLARKQNGHPLAAEAARYFAEFLRQRSREKEGRPVRNFRCFVTVTFPEAATEKIDLERFRQNVEGYLKVAGLFPKPVEPTGLIRLLFRILNGRPDENPNLAWDELRPIHDQVLLADTVIERTDDGILVTPRKSSPFLIKVLSLKVPPKNIDFLKSNYFSGGFGGPKDDVNQIQVPFLFSCLVTYDREIEAFLKTKSTYEKNLQSFLPFQSEKVRIKHEEISQAVSDMEYGNKHTYVMPFFVLFCDPDKATGVVQQFETLFTGAELQEETDVALPMFLSGLPFPAYSTVGDLKFFARYQIWPHDTTLPFLPFQADCSGIGGPQTILVGRKGQLITLDLSHKGLRARNFMVTAATGSGKSVLMNKFDLDWLAEGVLIRKIDVGYSYLKTCELVDGQYVDLGGEGNVTLNPFHYIDTSDPKERELGVAVVAHQILQMCYSATDLHPAMSQGTELEITLLKGACSWAVSTALASGRTATIDLVYEWLRSFPDADPGFLEDVCKDNNECIADWRKLANNLALNLRDFTANGRYGWWFSNELPPLRFESQYIVLELEKMKKNPELFKIASIIVLTAITSEVYLRDFESRDQFLVVVFEECGDLLADNKLFSKVVEEAYRRIRKFGGAVGTIWQSPLDVERLGVTGQTVVNNSYFFFLLECSDYPVAVKKKILNLPEAAVPILDGIKTIKGRGGYAEIGVFAGKDYGFIGRNELDPFTYLVSTTDGEEFAKLSKLKKQHGSWVKAIKAELEGCA